METCLRVLLIIGVATAAPTGPPQSTLPSHEDAILSAVELYNLEPGITLAYRLLEAEPQPDWDTSTRTIQSLTFTVKETVCPVSEKRDINQCAFKEDGLVKDCSGFFSTEQDPPAALIKCEEAADESTPVTRGRWRKWGRKVGGFFRQNAWKILGGALKIFG